MLRRIARPIIGVAFLGKFFGADVVKVAGVFLQIFGLEIDTHRIHVWYIYLDMVDFYGKLVGKYTVRPMDPIKHGSKCLQK